MVSSHERSVNVFFSSCQAFILRFSLGWFERVVPALGTCTWLNGLSVAAISPELSPDPSEFKIVLAVRRQWHASSLGRYALSRDGS